MYRKLLAATAILSCSFTTLAAAELEEKPAVRLQLSGETKGSWLVIRAALGQGVTRAVRVYAEPSHTLLATYMNGEVPEPVNTAWLHSVTSAEERARPRFPLMTFPFREGAAGVVNTMAAPASDTSLKVIIFGSFSDENGVVREQEIPFTVNTNLGKFAFTYLRRMVPEVASDRLQDVTSGVAPDAVGSTPRNARRLKAVGQICCGVGTGTCGQECTTCTDPVYCCTYQTDTECGWCAKNSASCGECNVCGGRTEN